MNILKEVTVLEYKYKSETKLFSDIWTPFSLFLRSIYKAIDKMSHAML